MECKNQWKVLGGISVSNRGRADGVNENAVCRCVKVLVKR